MEDIEEIFKGIEEVLGLLEIEKIEINWSDFLYRNSDDKVENLSFYTKNA